MYTIVRCAPGESERVLFRWCGSDRAHEVCYRVPTGCVGVQIDWKVVRTVQTSKEVRDDTVSRIRFKIFISMYAERSFCDISFFCCSFSVVPAYIRFT